MARKRQIERSRDETGSVGTRSEAFSSLVAHFARRKDVTSDRGWTDGRARLKVAGKIFAMSSNDQVVFKLPKATVDAMVAQGDGERFDPRRDGRLMTEWVVVDPEHVDLVELAEAACTFVGRKTGSSGRRG